MFFKDQDSDSMVLYVRLVSDEQSQWIINCCESRRLVIVGLYDFCVITSPVEKVLYLLRWGTQYTSFVPASAYELIHGSNADDI